jgi:SAM-dependent methyltransferase
MKESLIPLLVCPECRRDLGVRGDHEREAGEIRSASLACENGHEFLVEEWIPRFVPRVNYASSFGLQWNRFSRTQLDLVTLAPISRTRFFEETRWPEHLPGEMILEVGAGAGRFTPHAAGTGATVVAVDYSDAIDAARRNNTSWVNVHYLQADLRKLPLRPGQFDKIYCLGVLQHTPAPEASFRSLLPALRHGGEIVFDVYRLSWKTLFTGKYYLRPITTRVRPEDLLRYVAAYVRLMYPLLGILHRVSRRMARVVAKIFGIADYRGLFDIPMERLYEMSVLDTFDALSPAHDHPQTLASVRKWLLTAGLVDADVGPGYNGIEARGRVP